MSDRASIQYHVQIGDRIWPARTLSGREAMSQPFHLVARFAVDPAEAPDPDEVLRAPAAVVIVRDGREERRIDGLVSGVSVSATARGAPEVEVVLEPRIALCRHRRDIRVFRDKSAPDIVAEVMQALGVKVERRLGGSYATRPYCVQMRETDLAFVSRLLEDEGIAYFVDEGDTVVLCDAPEAYEVLAGDSTLPFRAGSGLDAHDEAVIAIGERAALCAGRVSLRDFNPEHPSLDMDVSAAVSGSDGPELYDYPGEYLAPSEGAQKAARRAESIAASSQGMRGQSFCPRLAPGRRFELAEAPAAIPATGLLVTALEHDFDRDASGFSNRFEAIDARAPWRPPLSTPEPQLPNPMTAFVTGPPGADVHTDGLGRVKIRFPWDRLQPFDDRASDWVPVLQDNTGHSVGIPRVGWEVLVHFLEGDPDRPVVLGRVYNGSDTFPEVLPKDKTRSALRSMSSPTRDGHNVIRFDDRAGAEQMFVHAERDQNVVVTLDKREDIGADESVVVQRDETRAVGGNETVAVGGDRRTTVNGSQFWHVGGDRKREVGAESGASVGGDHQLRIGTMHTRRIGTMDAVAVKDLKEQVGAVILEAAAGDIAWSSVLASSLTVGGVLVEAARKDKVEQTKLVRAETIGGVVLSKSGGETSASTTGRIVSVGGALKITAGQTITFDAGANMHASALLGRFDHPSGITLKVDGSTVSIGGGVVSIETGGDIVVSVDGDALEQSAESKQN